jgi:diguanylate cyclase (GGDEF)-like protein/PAS domain S-box-containing protein
MKVFTRSSAFWRGVVDRVPVGVFIIDQAGAVVHWNAWLAQQTGIAHGDVVRRTLPDLFPGLDETQFTTALAEVVSGGSTRMLSRALNRFLIPVKVRGREPAEAPLMRQRVQLSPLKAPDGALLVLVTVFDVTDFVARIQALLKLTQTLEEKSNRDPLTGLYNRGFMADWLDQQLKIATRRGESLTCLLLDVDRFKIINDTHGHPVGDAVLQGLAEVIRSQVRESDVVVRYGGEEFAILMPSCALGDGVGRATDIIDAVRASAFGPLRTGAVTCSGGVSAFGPELTCTAPELVDRSDRLLYAAKNAGGNRVFASLPG